MRCGWRAGPRRCTTVNRGCGWPTAAGWTCFSILAVSCTRIDRCGRPTYQLRRRARSPSGGDGGRGMDGQCRPISHPNNPEHLATVEFAPMDRVTDDQRRRADAILIRRTDRLPFMAPFTAPTDWESFEPVLRSQSGRRRGTSGRIARRDASTACRGGPAHRIAAPLRLRIPFRTRLVDSTVRSVGGNPVQFSDFGRRGHDRVGVNRVFPSPTTGKGALRSDRITRRS